MSNLVIVESPAKASTIKGYLGTGYKVVASKGHIRDLPKSTLGVDVDNGFEPHYINIRGKSELLKELRREAKNAKKIFLATDPDREGEAISWHLAETLGIKPNEVYRVTFNEITKTAVKEAIKKPRKIDNNLVNAQQARRILDRIVGYKLSPLLWKTVKGRLSAGRVQSVATRIIAEREAEIRAFVPVEYYTLTVSFKTDSGEEFNAKYYDKEEKRYRISSKAATDKILADINNGKFIVSSVKTAKKLKSPPPPFTTSTMQQEASKRLGFPTSKIMKLAQELYEGVNLGASGVHGLITYMRTDSLRISESAQKYAAEYIASQYGESYLPESTRNYKARAGAQDAHEAIRPVSTEFTPASVKKLLTADQYKLYKLIWDRFIASQMSNAVINSSVADIENSGYLFKVFDDSVAFAGYLAVYDTADALDEEEGILGKIPSLKKNQVLFATKIADEQHFTEPPARYTEASLIKFLEENGIGRPSTYAPIVTTIIARNYVKRDGKTLVPTELGEITTEIMKKSVPEIIDYDFTASMENKLDAIENGDASINDVLSEFYIGFMKELSEAEKTLGSVKTEAAVEESEYICEKCGSPMIYKNGRYGRFLACSTFPKCRNTLAVGEDGKPATKVEKTHELADFKCEKCGGDIYIREGRYGKFYACSNYPSCKFTKPMTRELGLPCPKCGSKLIARIGKNSDFYTCEKYPECDFSSWDEPTDKKCPDCGEMLFIKKSKGELVCKAKGCGYKEKCQ